MGAAFDTPVSEHLKRITPASRRLVSAARRAVKAAAPGATELGYRTAGRRSATSRSMYKIVRYLAHDEQVVGIGVFAMHASLFFRRGSELDDPRGLLEGSGKARFIRLRVVADAERPAVKRLIRKAFALSRSSRAVRPRAVVRARPRAAPRHLGGHRHRAWRGSA